MTQEQVGAPEFDYGLFSYDSKEQMIAKSKEYLGSVNVMQGMHQKMRARAAQWHDYKKGK